jgi:hypothetical protein
VYVVKDYAELQKRVEAKECVVMFFENDGHPPREYMGYITPPLVGGRVEVEPLYLMPVEQFGFLESTVTKLRKHGKSFLGDVAKLDVQECQHALMLNPEEIMDLQEHLASFGIALGMKVPHWLEVSSKLR